MQLSNDLNIFGMHPLTFADCTARKPLLPHYQAHCRKLVHPEADPLPLFATNSLNKTTTCYLELDVYYKNVVNRYFLLHQQRTFSMTRSS
jgi:hypothetical protein